MKKKKIQFFFSQLLILSSSFNRSSLERERKQVYLLLVAVNFYNSMRKRRTMENESIHVYMYTYIYLRRFYKDGDRSVTVVKTGWFFEANGAPRSSAPMMIIRLRKIDSDLAKGIYNGRTMRLLLAPSRGNLKKEHTYTL